MGSGGGGGSTGITFKKPRRSRQPGHGKGGGGGGQGGGGGRGGGDVCYLSFETNLAAVDPAVTSSLEGGESLTVGMIDQAGYPAVICRTRDGRRVGSLANVEDLAQLIACIRAGHEYVAEVRDVGRTHCTVFVEHG